MNREIRRGREREKGPSEAERVDELEACTGVDGI